MTKKYYVVQAKCGHVGRGKYIVKEFPIRAFSRSEAAEIARQKPRVKHDYKDAIVDVEEVSREEYMVSLQLYESDPFMKSKSIQEQRYSCGNMIDEIKIEFGFGNRFFEYDKYERRERVAFKKKKMKEKYGI